MSKVQWKGGALLAPVPPVLVTCAAGDRQNVFTVAWTGIINTNPPKTYISVRPSRYSYGLIAESGEFVINLTTAALVRATDSCGVYTGKKVDKFRRFHLTPEPASVVRCPCLAESPLSLECRVTDRIPLGTHEMFLADIVAADVDEQLLDRDGRLCLERANLLAYAHGDYFALGKRLGGFGFSVKKR
ncbi:MAG: flavin reductase family protein [Eubacteriales bacterium]|nr:flavin reductase family protein [Eubacteriales bacterium]